MPVLLESIAQAVTSLDKNDLLFKRERQEKEMGPNCNILDKKYRQRSKKSVAERIKRHRTYVQEPCYTPVCGSLSKSLLS